MNRARAKRLARDLKAMTMLDAVLVAQHIEEGCGPQTAAGVVAMLQHAVGASQEERSNVLDPVLDILLQDKGNRPIHLIKVLRKHLDLTLKEAKVMVDSVPLRVFKSLPRSVHPAMSNEQRKQLYKDIILAGAAAQAVVDAHIL